MHSPRKIEFDQLLEKVLQHKEKGLPYVLYALPNERKVKALFQNDAVLNTAIDFKENGFVFAPFDTSKETILIKPDAFFISEHREEEFLQNTTKQGDTKNKKSHIALVDKAIKEIRSGNLKKVVLSRKISSTTDEDSLTLFLRALSKYASAFCYLWFHPKVGSWLGATPEQLVSFERAILKTTSLAGTLPVLGNKEPNWTSKELEEQQLVTDFLKQGLKKYTEIVTIDKITSVKAGELWHLKTNLSARLQNRGFLKDIIDVIHPSPAVCGIPKKAAKDFILKSEGYDRSFYTGFLGELNLGHANKVQLFVNLRCMELQDGKATIFVGGGITADSDPEKEWEETKNKYHTMASLF